MAKKWQDVEFVDYKERQKRRRMRKRMSSQEELATTVQSRWNFTLIFSIAFLFMGLIGTSSYFLFIAQEKQEDAESKMFIESRKIKGDASYRKSVVDEYVAFAQAKRFYNSGQFRTGLDSEVELVTFDDVILKLMPLSELTVDGIEIFGQNKRTKTNITAELGEVIFDSRKSGGLLEVRAGSLVVYAGRALFKIVVDGDSYSVKLSQGLARVEYYQDSRELSSSQMVVVKDAALSQVQTFNPLAETW